MLVLHAHSHAASQLPGAQVVRVAQLAELTRDAVDAWSPQHACIAVVDSGHHSCLAAAIRLQAVWRLPNVVLLQLTSSATNS